MDPKTVFEPYPKPKKSPLGPKNSKMTQKLGQNQMSEFKETARATALTFQTKNMAARTTHHQMDFYDNVLCNFSKSYAKCRCIYKIYKIHQ